jgi:hypothetical protein
MKNLIGKISEGEIIALEDFGAWEGCRKAPL